MFCLLPPTRLALGLLPPEKVPDASGLFNLMRNLGGAIGIAMIDSIIYGRSPIHAKAITQQLLDGNVATAKAVGIPLELFAMRAPGPLDASTRAMLEPLVSKLAFVQAMNEAWAVVAFLTFAVLFSVLFARSGRLDAPSPAAPG
jgi:DHA2 family multidrug resistance protein